MATPIEAETSRLGPVGGDSGGAANTTSPGFRRLTPPAGRARTPPPRTPRRPAPLPPPAKQVARRKTPQRPPGPRRPPGDPRGPPFPPLALEGPEQVDRGDLAGRHAGRHRLRQLRPARALPGRQRTREAGVWACCHRPT